MGLTDLGERQLRVALVAPEESFSLRPLSVTEPFRRGDRPTFELADIARELGLRLILDRISRVHPNERVIDLERGGALAYDALIIAVGARPRPAHPRVLTFDGPDAVPRMRELVGAVGSGRVASLAFVVTGTWVWPLPMYELALMTRRRAERGRIVLVTPERAPLELFGERAADMVSKLLDAAQIEVHAGVEPRIAPDARSVALGTDRGDVEVDRIVTLPLLEGPALDGVPHDDRGFIPIDEHCQVPGLERVYAAGDGTDFPVKHGGLATQQAHAAVRHLTSQAGGALRPEPFRPVLRGRLITTERHQSGEAGAPSGELLWWPPAKVTGRYLSQWVGERTSDRRWSEPPAGGVSIERLLPPLDPAKPPPR